jgi:serine/threonine-protein kinase
MIEQALGRYNVLEKIGEGGMGVVYLAHDSELNRDVALKVLRDEVAHDATRMERFRREAQVLASLNHPSIASIFGIEEYGDSGALVMDSSLAPRSPSALRRARYRLTRRCSSHGRLPRPSSTPMSTASFIAT